MQPSFIEQATTMIERLKTLDSWLTVFGARHHGYCFNPPLPLETVTDFEQTHGITLPTPYRQFITELGNGGAGPYYGILPLPREAPQLQFLFPHTQPFELADDDPAWNTNIPGTITIAEYGCGIFILLVVRGEAAGEVWVDGRYEQGIVPANQANHPSLSFDSWWLGMMGAHLARFETINELMQAATPHEAIHQRLEPGILQLDVDLAMLSIMGHDPDEKPQVYAQKPWGKQCGLVEQYYDAWLQRNQANR